MAHEAITRDEETKIEEIRMIIQKATSEYMPVYRRIFLNDAVEVEIRKLLTQKRTVTREWVGEFTHEIFVWSPKKGGTLSDVVTRRLKELGIEVTE